VIPILADEARIPRAKELPSTLAPLARPNAAPGPMPSREARRACEELTRYELLCGGEAQYEIGEVRLRIGDLDGAREAFRRPTS
jgi:hypothetical protein